MGQNRFKKLSKFQKFQLSNLIDFSKLSDLFKRTTTKNENIGQTYIKKHLN